MRRFFAILTLLALVAATGHARQGFVGQFGDDPFSGGRGGNPVIATAESSAETVAPGARLVLALTLDHDAGWHSWPAEELGLLPDEINSFAIHTQVGLQETPDWVSAIGPVQWPEPHEAPVANPMGGDPIEVPTFDGTATMFLPLLIAEDAEPGTYAITLAGTYQACDDAQCLMPSDPTFTFEITIDPDAPETEFTGVFAGFNATVYNAMSTGVNVGEEQAGDTDTDATTGTVGSGGGAQFFGVKLGTFDGPLGIMLLALISAIGGFILNLTPCVLPVIPIKIMTLSQHAGSPGKSFMLGLWMAMGVVAFWLAIGIPAAFVARFADPSIMFGIWWVTGGIGLIIAIMALGLMGMFSITLPQKAYVINPEADSPGGSFLFGIMTAILGLPCFGFVAGALLPAASTLGPAVTITVFAFMGIGMAAPYLVLSANPKWVDKIPRTGPASELVKQVMGLLLLAAAAYFIGSGVLALVSDYPYLATKLHYWVIALIGIFAGGLLLVRTFQITRKPLPRLSFAITGVIIAGLGLLVAWGATSQAAHEYAQSQDEREVRAASGELLTSTWIDFSEPALQKALDEGHVAVLDFTAEWCINCKALKASVLNVNPVKNVLESDRVVMFKVDLTSRRAKGWDKLKSFGQTGIPTLVVMGGELEEPWISNAYTQDQVMTALRDAGVIGSDGAPGLANAQ